VYALDVAVAITIAAASFETEATDLSEWFTEFPTILVVFL
jgi:hypothetical protein